MLMRHVIHIEVRVMMAQIIFFFLPLSHFKGKRENYSEFRLECLVRVPCQNTSRQISAA